jgi:hypothetical protein
MYYACPEVFLLCIAANHPLCMWASSNAWQSLFVWCHSKTLNQDTICSAHTIRHTINISITNNLSLETVMSAHRLKWSISPVWNLSYTVHCIDPCNLSWSPVLHTLIHCAMCTGHLSLDIYTLCNKTKHQILFQVPNQKRFKCTAASHNASQPHFPLYIST